MTSNFFSTFSWTCKVPFLCAKLYSHANNLSCLNNYKHWVEGMNATPYSLSSILYCKARESERDFDSICQGPRGDTQGALWCCAETHELLSCFSVLFFKVFRFTPLMVFASPIIVIIFIQLFQFYVVAWELQGFVLRPKGDMRFFLSKFSKTSNFQI